jgi:hypothetical protein
MTTTTNRRHTAARLAAVATVAVALPLMSAVSPTVASAHRADPFSGSATHRVGSVGTADVAEGIAYRKAQAAQYYVDHALELYQRAAR